MIRMLGVCVLVMLGVVLTINGAFMLVSPRAWFRLPPWLGKHGSLTENEYSTGWGAVQLRLTGAVMLAIIAWVLYDAFLKRG